MPRLFPWTKKYKLSSSKKWTIRKNVSFSTILTLNKHAHWSKYIRKKKDPDEENSFSESDDALSAPIKRQKKEEKLVSPSDPREWKRK